MKPPIGPRIAVPAAPTKVAVPIPKKPDGRAKLIGNLGTYAHPPKGKKK